MDVYFSDFFGVSAKTIEKYGAFNISLVADLPLFIDPFPLFNSKKPIYRSLHDQIIECAKLATVTLAELRTSCPMQNMIHGRDYAGFSCSLSQPCRESRQGARSLRWPPGWVTKPRVAIFACHKAFKRSLERAKISVPQASTGNFLMSPGPHSRSHCWCNGDFSPITDCRAHYDCLGLSPPAPACIAVKPRS